MKIAKNKRRMLHRVSTRLKFICHTLGVRLPGLYWSSVPGAVGYNLYVQQSSKNAVIWPKDMKVKP